MKKILILLFFIISLFLVSCDSEFLPPQDDMKVYQVIGDHNYSNDLYLNVSYLVDDNNPSKQYLESNVSICIQGFVDQLVSFATVKKVETDNINTYVESKVGEEYMYIESNYLDSNLKIYVLKTGVVILVKDGKAYETNESVVRYYDFCQIKKISIDELLYKNISFQYKEESQNYTTSSSVGENQWLSFNLDKISYDEITDVYMGENIVPAETIKSQYINYYRDYLYYNYLKDILKGDYYVLECPYMTYGKGYLPIINTGLNKELKTYLTITYETNKNFILTQSGYLWVEVTEDNYSPIYLLNETSISLEDALLVKSYLVSELNDRIEEMKENNGIE